MIISYFYCFATERFVFWIICALATVGILRLTRFIFIYLFFTSIWGFFFYLNLVVTVQSDVLFCILSWVWFTVFRICDHFYWLYLKFLKENFRIFYIGPCLLEIKPTFTFWKLKIIALKVTGSNAPLFFVFWVWNMKTNWKRWKWICCFYMFDICLNLFIFLCFDVKVPSTVCEKYKGPMLQLYCYFKENLCPVQIKCI